MNPTAHISYLGNLRTEAVHLRSQNQLITDAPLDNHGRGEAFSPTDLVAAALVSCMITVMGIAANTHNIPFGGVSGEVQKIMGENPRRIVGLKVLLRFEGADYTERERSILEHTARTCPVSQSLHPDLVQEISFEYV